MLSFPAFSFVLSVSACLCLYCFAFCVWSKFDRKTNNKRFVRQGSGSTTFRFMVPGDGCGTQSVAGKLNLGYYNTLVVQTEETVQEVWDTSHRIQCFTKPTTQLVAFQPLTNVEDIPVEQEIKTAILVGNGLDGQPVNQTTTLKIGDQLTLVFYVYQNFKDVVVKNCFASDGQAIRVRLTDDNGCPLRPKLMQSFKRNGNTIYASLTTFRLAEKTTLALSCDIELCSISCRNSTAICSPGSKPFPSVSSPPPTKPPIQISFTTTPTTRRPYVPPTPSLYITQRPQPSYPATLPSYISSVVCRPGYSPCPPIYRPNETSRYRWKATGYYPIN